MSFRASLGSGSPEEKVKACYGVDKSITTPQKADRWLTAWITKLLAQYRDIEAGYLLWGPDIFDSRPECVQRILRAINGGNKIIILGGSSCSKSYTSIVALFLDYLRDPRYTSIRLCSTSGKHALNNVFSVVQRLHACAIVKLPGLCQHGYVAVDRLDRACSIQIVAIREGDNNSLQGAAHPQRRPRPHPQYGVLTRVRVLVDEAEMCPEQLFRALDNVLASEHGNYVKVICTANPRIITKPLAMLAEPKHKTWNQIDVDRDINWKSVKNYDVVRVDPMRLENIRYNKVIFPGLMTPQGFQNYMSKGPGSPDWWTFGRGMYPLSAVGSNLISYELVEKLWGEWVFQAGTFVDCLSIDPAHEGGDLCIACVGKYGLAVAMRMPDGKIIHLAEPRWALQIHQFFSLTKGMVQKTADQVRALAKRFSVTPRYIAVDKTGSGYGIFCNLVEAGWDVLGCAWGAAASNRKILDIHRLPANELCDGFVSEAYFAFKDWLEADLIRCSVNAEKDRFIKGLTGRQMIPSRRIGNAGEPLRRISQKSDFIADYGWSPDHSDSAVQLLMLVRLRGESPEAKTVGRRMPVPRLYSGDEEMTLLRPINGLADVA